MQLPFFFLAWLLCAGALSGCASGQTAEPGASEAGTHEVWVGVVSWHTAIVLPRVEVAASGLLPEAADFPDAAFLEFGWGDRAYYTAEDKSLGLALEAAATPSPSVMHVAGLAQRPEAHYAANKLRRLALTEAGFHRLLRAISSDFDRAGAPRAEAISQGLSPNSRFYEAEGSFHLFNTCNTWTARKLQAAGVDISPAGVITTGDVMTQLGTSPAPRRAVSP